MQLLFFPSWPFSRFLWLRLGASWGPGDSVEEQQTRIANAWPEEENKVKRIHSTRSSCFFSLPLDKRECDILFCSHPRKSNSNNYRFCLLAISETKTQPGEAVCCAGLCRSGWHCPAGAVPCSDPALGLLVPRGTCMGLVPFPARTTLYAKSVLMKRCLFVHSVHPSFWPWMCDLLAQYHSAAPRLCVKQMPYLTEVIFSEK